VVLASRFAPFDFDDKTQIFCGAESAQFLERLEDGERIFALEIRREVEEEQKREGALRDLEMSPAEEVFQVDLSCLRHVNDGLRHSGRDRIVSEFRRRPDFVESVELVCPFFRIPAQLPHRIDHVVGIPGYGCPEMPQRSLNLITVDVEDIDIPAEVLNQVVLEFILEIRVRIRRTVNVLQPDVTSDRLKGSKGTSEVLAHTDGRERMTGEDNSRLRNDRGAYWTFDNHDRLNTHPT